MEQYSIQYLDAGTMKTFGCIAESPEDAEEQLVRQFKGKGTRNRYEITEIIPGGIVSGFDVTIYDREMIEL